MNRSEKNPCQDDEREGTNSKRINLNIVPVILPSLPGRHIRNLPNLLIDVRMKNLRDELNKQHDADDTEDIGDPVSNCHGTFILRRDGRLRRRERRRGCESPGEQTGQKRDKLLRVSLPVSSDEVADNCCQAAA